MNTKLAELLYVIETGSSPATVEMQSRHGPDQIRELFAIIHGAAKEASTVALLKDVEPSENYTRRLICRNLELELLEIAQEIRDEIREADDSLGFADLWDGKKKELERKRKDFGFS